MASTGTTAPSASSVPTRVPTALGAPEPLAPGRLLSTEGFEPTMAFVAPEGWFGGGDQNGWGAGLGLDEVEQRFAACAFYVAPVDRPIAAACAHSARWAGSIAAGRGARPSVVTLRSPSPRG